MRNISTDDVLEIHDALVDEFHGTDRPIDPPGVKDKGLLESAVSRPLHSFGGREKYSGVFEKAATLTFGIACNHPFYNGNKRTAFVTMLSFLERNDLTIGGVTYDEIQDVMIWLAGHQLYEKLGKRIQRHVTGVDERDRDIYALASWIKKHKREPTKRGDRAMTFHDLDQTLRRHGYSLENPDGNRIDVMKHGTEKKHMWSRPTPTKRRIDSITFPGMKRVAGVGTVKHVREICHLTNIYGVDSEMFYEGASPIPQFIDRYRKILIGLANR